MSVDVRQQLDRLAQDAPTGVAPSDLWQRGVRRRRRRLAGGVAASVLAVLVGGGLAGAIVSVTPRPSVAPAATDGAAIPRAVIVPDPWTAGTDREGPPGRLAVVLGAERMTGWGNSSDGLVGVSATTGEYRFLDLPGRLLGASGEDNPAEVVSPDGRTVAYWMMGDNERLGGIAAYDTVTGEVTRQPLPSSLGIEPVVMRWTDSSTVLLQYANVTQRSDNTSSGTVTALYAWTRARVTSCWSRGRRTPRSNAWPRRPRGSSPSAPGRCGRGHRPCRCGAASPCRVCVPPRASTTSGSPRTDGPSPSRPCPTCARTRPSAGCWWAGCPPRRPGRSGCARCRPTWRSSAWSGGGTRRTW